MGICKETFGKATIFNFIGRLHRRGGRGSSNWSVVFGFPLKHVSYSQIYINFLFRISTSQIDFPFNIFLLTFVPSF